MTKLWVKKFKNSKNGEEFYRFSVRYGDDWLRVFVTNKEREAFHAAGVCTEGVLEGDFKVFKPAEKSYGYMFDLKGTFKKSKNEQPSKADVADGLPF